MVLPFPVLDDDALSKIVKINREGDLPGYQTYVASGLYEVDGGAAALTAKLDELCAEISAAIAEPTVALLDVIVPSPLANLAIAPSRIALAKLEA